MLKRNKSSIAQQCAERKKLIVDSEDKISRIYKFAKNIRRMALDMALDAGKNGAHVGGSFSAIEIFSVLYGGVLKYDISNPVWNERDRFIPSKTHCILANFPALVEAGFLSEDQLMSFHKDGGLLAGHPWRIDIGLEFAGGSLGMGLSVGIGMALRAKRKKLNYRTYVLLGDGECNEGAVWEALMSACKFKLDNLIAIVDYNNMQFDGMNDQIMSIAPLAEKILAFGWKVVEVNGHSIEELYNAFNIEHDGQPLAIVAHTIKACGIPSIENKAESHHSSITREDYEYVLNRIEEGEYDRV